MLLMPLSLFAWQFLPVGAIAATIFGVWLAIYTQLSPFALEKKRSSVLLAARRKEKRAAEADYEWLVRGEYEQREKRLATVKKLVSSLELFWAQIQQEFQYRHSAADGRIRVAIQSVLDLPKAIQIELQNLTANGCDLSPVPFTGRFSSVLGRFVPERGIRTRIARLRSSGRPSSRGR